MTIAETSKAPSRTIGLKPLLVGEYSAKSSVTRSDLIEPFFSTDVPGWSPSKVRKRIVISIGQGFIEIDEARLLQRLAHIVHVEPERASGKLLALALFVGPFDVADNDRLHASSSKPVNLEPETSYQIQPAGAEARGRAHLAVAGAWTCHRSARQCSTMAIINAIPAAA